MDVANWSSEVVGAIVLGIALFVIFVIGMMYIAGRQTTPSNQTPENREDKPTAKNP